MKQHSIAFKTVKTYLTETPVLKYDVTIQCDDSERGLGAVLVQNGQPVSYASRALTDTETLRPMQIEKELLAIVWSCKKFNQYIYGRDVVQIESDHEPLQAVFKKSTTKETPENENGPTKLLSGHKVHEERPLNADALSGAYRKTTDATEHDNGMSGP